LNQAGRMLVVSPCTVPFQIEMCDVARYDGTFTDVVNPPAAQRTGVSARLDPAMFAGLHERHHPAPARLNLQRR